MKKSLLFPIGIIIAAAISYLLHLSVDNFSIQIKFGFLSKILLMVGIVSLLLFWLDRPKKVNKSNE